MSGVLESILGQSVFPCACGPDSDSDSEQVLQEELREPAEDKFKFGGTVKAGKLSRRSDAAVPSTVPGDLLEEDLDEDETVVILSAQSLEAFPRAAVGGECRILDVSRNLLDRLEPAHCVGLTKLVELDLSRNKIRAIPWEVAKLVSLLKLNLLSNSLLPLKRSLPVDALATLPLVVLDVRYNKKLKADAEKTLNDALPGCEVLVSSEPKAPKAAQSCDLADSCAGARDARSLRAQLEPYSTPQLERRLEVTFGRQPTTRGDRDATMRDLLAAYASEGVGDGLRCRDVVYASGAHLREALAAELLEELRRTTWAATRERPRVNAADYLTLQRPRTKYYDADGNYNATGQKALKNAAKLQKHRALWDLACAALEAADPAFAQTFTSLAVTHNFVGSPHIDTENVGPFYGCSLGDFSPGGGKIAVEFDASTVCHIDTRGKFAKVDGRFPHWVTEYTGERYSLIYYRTEGDPDPLPDVPVEGAYRLQGLPKGSFAAYANGGA